MANLIEVEISLANGEWQWIGKLSPDSLSELCKLADTLSDKDTEAKS